MRVRARARVSVRVRAGAGGRVGLLWGTAAPRPVVRVFSSYSRTAVTGPICLGLELGSVLVGVRISRGTG